MAFFVYGEEIGGENQFYRGTSDQPCEGKELDRFGERVAFKIAHVPLIQREKAYGAEDGAQERKQANGGEEYFERCSLAFFHIYNKILSELLYSYCTLKILTNCYDKRARMKKLK